MIKMPTILKRIRGTALVDTSKGILLVRTKTSGDFILPGGGGEQGETPEQAMSRELKEETGLVAQEHRYLFGLKGSIFKDDMHSKGKLTQNHHSVFLVKARGRPKPMSETVEIAYYKPGSKIKIGKNSARIIGKYNSQIKYRR